MAEPIDGEPGYFSTARVEAFSDGVFAVAITLLVLDIHVPTLAPHQSLLDALVDLRWNYLSFFISFLTIGIIWINHHNTFTIIKRTDHVLLMLNVFLLLGVSLIPFPTALVAEFLKEGNRDAEQTAGLVYAGTWIAMGAVFNILWRYATHNMRLVGRDIDPMVVKTATRQYNLGVSLYVVCFVIAFFSVEASLAANLALALLFALPSFGTGADKQRKVARTRHEATVTAPAEADTAESEAAG